VTNLDAAVRAARANGADVIVAPFNDPMGRDAMAEAPEPHPGRGQVRVRVRTIGVNQFDAKVRSGAMVSHAAAGAG